MKDFGLLCDLDAHDDVVGMATRHQVRVCCCRRHCACYVFECHCTAYNTLGAGLVLDTRGCCQGRL